MRKLPLLVLVFVLISSCIPLRIAPKIDDYKVSKGKKFKRGLPARQMFIFTDTKEEAEFYKYINTKYQLNHINVYDNIPFRIQEKQYFFSFYEVEIVDKSFNIATPVLATLGNRIISGDGDTIEVFNPDTEIKRVGNYYIAIEVYSDNENDCLVEDSVSRESVLKYLRALKKQYLATDNYNEVLFKD